MKRALLLLLFVACAASARAQGDGDIACRVYPPTTVSYKKKLWDGYEISLGPARNATGAGEDQCTAAIYNRAGRVVFRTTGFGVIFDQDLTGTDFDGDGKGEVVFQTDEGGGAHCCWIYNVVTLAPKPHKLFDVGQGAAVNFHKDKDGTMVIWELVGGTTEYASGAGRPYAERVYRVHAAKLEDATPEFCSEVFARTREADDCNKALTPENLRKLQSAKKFGGEGNFDLDDVVSALLSRALQRVLCHQYDEALADLNQWPEDSRDEMKDNFAESIKSYSPQFATRLAGGATAAPK
jgi:hypothetical protein